MTQIAFFGALETGLLYALVGLGIYLSFRILEFPDLTVDGSFSLGGAVAATSIVQGVNPFLATGLAICAGAIAGFVTAWLNVQLKILHLLASILVTIALYSINLRIMGQPNVPLLGQVTVITPLKSLFPGMADWILKPLFLFLVVILFKFALDFFLNSELGLAMRATGANPGMAKAQGIDTDKSILLGMALSNALVALAGALFAQTNQFSDVTMGVGTIVFGLAAVIVGEAFFSESVVHLATVGAIIGSIVYRIAVAIALNSNALGLQASDLNLVTSILVALALILPKSRSRLQGMLKRAKSS